MSGRRENAFGRVIGVTSSGRNLMPADDIDVIEEVLKKQSSLHGSGTAEEKIFKQGSLKNVEAQEKKENSSSWDGLTIEEIFKKLQTSNEKGLSFEEASIRLKKYGLNQLEQEKRPSFCVLFLMQLLNIIIMLLIASAVASLVVSAIGPDKKMWESYLDAVAIFLIVLLNAAIGAYTENSAAGALEALSKLSQSKSNVIRDGKQQQVASTELTLGDIVVLTVGDIVPADLRLIVADDLKVNEMLLTGEPEDVNKHARMKSKDAPERLTAENMVFSSCMVTNGKAKAVVVEIGMQTKVGRIALLLKTGGDSPEKKEDKKEGWCSCLPDDNNSGQTPLQESLENLGVRLGIFAIFACIVIFILGVSLGSYDINRPTADSTVDILIYMVLISVTLAVAAIPEGIPLCVTIALSTGCSDMVKQNVLVRKLAAVETLGCASVICTDKTGTLTEGKMTMVKMWTCNHHFDVSGKGFNPTVGKVTFKGTQDDAKEHPGILSTLCSAILCCNTTVVKENDPSDGTTKWVPHGNSSEAPIVVAAIKIGLNLADIEKTIPRIFEIPFSSSRKMMLTVNKFEQYPHALKLLPVLGFEKAVPNFLANIKGAPNYILEKCDSWMSSEGIVTALTEADKKSVLQKVDQLSSEALRVLAVACRPFTEMPFDPETTPLSSDEKFNLIVHKPRLILLGLVASIDPERDGVPDAVLKAQGGHIRVIMITGDYLTTAKAIAHNVNILHKNDDENLSALDCGRLRPDGKYLGDAEMDTLTKSVKVYARAQPEDKLQIVKSLQRQGLVCAMTGDGVNDAPALKRADIGVAMGLNGTEVAKGASSMVLTDDNFCSIVKAVEKGRIIYGGIQKFVAFILSIHIGEVIAIFICIVADLPIMRTPLQILFLNLLTELPPSIALGMERASGDILSHWPRPKTQPILTKSQWIGIIVNSFILAATTIAVYIWGLSHYLENIFTVKTLAERICKGSCDTQSAKEGDLNKELIESLRFARTVAFITVVFANDIRAYSSRSFTEPIWRDMLGAFAMHVALGISLIVLILALFVPGFSDEVLELEGTGIRWEGWIAALIASLATLLLCELYKLLTRDAILASEKSAIDRANELEQERFKSTQKATATGPQAAQEIIKE